MKSILLAILSSIFIYGCSDSNVSAQNQNAGMKSTSKQFGDTAGTASTQLADIVFPYLAIARDSLNALLSNKSFNRIIFNFYPERSGQSTILRLVGVRLKPNRDTLGDPLLNLLKILPESSGKYQPLRPAKQYYFPQYELTDSRIRSILKKVKGNQNVIFKPVGPNSYPMGYEITCTDCTESLGYLPPCPPYKP